LTALINRSPVSCGVTMPQIMEQETLGVSFAWAR
jgi:hypothetical protein